MLLVYTLLSSALTLAFAWLVFTLGRAMFAVTSVKAALDIFAKHPEKGTLIEKYFYGWAFPWQASLMRKLTAGSGDRLITLWWRASGAIFMIFALFFVFGGVMRWIFALMA